MKIYQKFILTINIFIFILWSLHTRQVNADEQILERNIINNFLVSQFQFKKNSQITQNKLDQVWNNLEIRDQYHLARFQIINQRLYADSRHASHIYFLNLLEFFTNLLSKYKIPDIDFMIYLSDELPSGSFNQEIYHLPIFLMSKDQDMFEENRQLLIPDALIIGKKWLKLAKNILAAKEKYPERNKINKIFWRGATTGQHQSFEQSSRIKLIFLSKIYPELIDAKFTIYTQFSNEKDQSLLKLLKIMNPEATQYFNETSHLQYKYLLAIDGNVTPWLRVPWIMLSNSVLLKQETSNMQWFYPALKAYKHYVPVKEDLSDLLIQLKWCEDNPKKLDEIIANANLFVINNLLQTQLEQDILTIFTEYKKLLLDKDLKPNLPRVDDIKTKWQAFNFYVKHICNVIKLKIKSW